MGKYGDFMGTLQQISALVVGEMWRLRFLNALLSGRMGICQRRGQMQQKRQKKTRRNQDDKNRQVDGQEESVYCICRRGEEGFMIQCSDCNKWFHGEYVRVTEQDADQIEDYFCDTCLEAAVEP